MALGARAAVDTASFARTIADFGPYNPHLVHDFAACSTTFGTGLLIAWRVPSWRPAALTLAALWNALHTISHIADADGAHPKALGPIEVALLLTASAALIWSIAEHRHVRRPRRSDRALSGDRSSKATNATQPRRSGGAE